MKEMTTEELLKEIEENHNNSLFEEIFKRRDKELYRTALFYKGTKINYLTLKYNVIKYAKALKAYGIKKGDEIPICMALIIFMNPYIILLHSFMLHFGFQIIVPIILAGLGIIIQVIIMHGIHIQFLDIEIM